MRLITDEQHAQIVDTLKLAERTSYSETNQDKFLAALAILQAAPEVEVVMYQYRWTNPGNAPGQMESMLAWQEVQPAWNQTFENKCDELRGYRYSGKVVYEVRSLYATKEPS